MKAGDTWYEIERKEGRQPPYLVSKTRGEVAKSGVCFFGAESVGLTEASGETGEQVEG